MAVYVCERHDGTQKYKGPHNYARLFPFQWGLVEVIEDEEKTSSNTEKEKPKRKRKKKDES
jgi:hypothetical protein